MNFLKTLIASLVALPTLFMGASAPTSPTLGSAVPSIQALFETSLQASITSNATSATLVSGLDIAGNNLLGYYCFTVDAGTPQNEFMCGNASGTILTNLVRGVNPALGITANVSLQYAHRRGADVKMTDAPYLSIYSNIFNGTQSIPSPLSYDPTISTVTAPSSTSNLPNWGQVTSYVNGVATSGAPDASQSAKGLVQIATPSQIASGAATSTDGAQTLWNVVSAGQYGKTYGATPTVVTNVYGNVTGTASTTYSYSGFSSPTGFTLPAIGSLIGSNYVTGYTSMVITVGGGTGYSANGGSAGGTISNPSTSTTWYYGAQGLGAGGGVGSVGGTAGGGNGGSGGTQSAGGNGGTGINSTNGSAGTAGQGGGGSVGSGGGGGGYYGGGGGGGSSSNGTTYCYGGTNGGNMAWFGTASSFSQATALLVGAGGGGGGGGCGGGYETGGVGGASTGGTGNTGFYSSSVSFEAGGGGGGSNFASSTLTSTTSTAGTSGSVSLTIVVTYTYNDPTENISSTVSGNNFGGTVMVSATTTHLSPTTSTINFAPWNFPVTGVSCTANTWASSLAPFILTETTTSVQFGFSSTIAGGKYDYICNAR